MASSSSLVMSIVLVLLLNILGPACWLAHAADEDPLQDFCVADYSSRATSLNGFPCKPADDVVSSDFKSSLLQSEGPHEVKLGIAINLVGAPSAPALNTMGMALGRLNFKPKGVNPPHVHPRANELFYLAQGTLIAGFVTTNNTLFQETLHAGDFFVFPRGLTHFQINPDAHLPAAAFAFFNSQNPGVNRLAAGMFASTPPLPDQVLETAFAIDKEELSELRASVATTLQIVEPASHPSCPAQCRQYCSPQARI
ncbi:hypothetical protein L7F22_031778 [Adiantum nelumboides]|nr:hypothetical protein [Adiantum nelumboides]